MLCDFEIIEISNNLYLFYFYEKIKIIRKWRSHFQISTLKMSKMHSKTAILWASYREMKNSQTILIENQVLLVPGFHG